MLQKVEFPICWHETCAKAGQAARDAALERANQGATQIPLDVLEKSVEALELALETARRGNPASASDSGVAGACALAAAEGAALNVRINLPSVSDTAAVERFASHQEELLRRAGVLAQDVRAAVDNVLNQPTS